MSKKANANISAVWKPIPNSSQALALDSRAHHTLFTGARGPGKTVTQLMRFRRFVGLGYGSFWRGVIFDVEYKHLDDLIVQARRWFEAFGDGARYIGGAQNKFRWPTGEELLFRVGSREKDYWRYHGQEFPFIGFNELTKQPTPVFYDMIQSCNRSSFTPSKDGPKDANGKPTLDPIPLETFSTTNPSGVGHGWVKKRFITVAPYGKVVKQKIESIDPATKQPCEIELKQVAIFGALTENIYLDPKYIATLLAETDPNRRKAWLQGSWDILSGGMFEDVWETATHVVPPFAIPHSWKIDRTFDWGSSKPFSVGWWAESDGSDVKMPDGSVRSTVRGDLFRIAEWYGTTGKPNEGLRMLASEVAKGIVEREIAMGLHGRVKDGPADSSIFDVENGNSIAVDMAKPVKVNGKMYRGVQWRRSDKSPGSRIAGWEKLRKYLQNAKKNIQTVKGREVVVPRESPGLFVFNRCSYFLDLFPSLPRDDVKTDDVDTDAEDHIGDETRYKILSVGVGAKGGRTTGDY